MLVTKELYWLAQFFIKMIGVGAAGLSPPHRFATPVMMLLERLTKKARDWEQHSLTVNLCPQGHKERE